MFDEASTHFAFINRQRKWFCCFAVFLSLASVFNNCEQKYYYLMKDFQCHSILVNRSWLTQSDKQNCHWMSLPQCLLQPHPSTKPHWNFQPQSKTIKHKRIDRGATNPKAKYVNNIWISFIRSLLQWPKCWRTFHCLQKSPIHSLVTR